MEDSAQQCEQANPNSCTKDDTRGRYHGKKNTECDNLVMKSWIYPPWYLLGLKRQLAAESSAHCLVVFCVGCEGHGDVDLCL